MATPTFLNGGENTGVSSLTISVTPTTGRLLVVAVSIFHAFDAPTVTGITWNGNAMTQTVALDGSGGGSYPWAGGAIYHYEVATGATANVVVSLSGTANNLVCAAVYEIAGYNTGAIVGDTDSAQTTASDHSLTLTTAADDVVIDCVVTQLNTDRWYEPLSGTTSGYNNDPRPGNDGSFKGASGYRVATGSSTAIGWGSWLGDAGPVPTSSDTLHVAAVFQTAATGAAITAANTLGAATSSATVKVLAKNSAANTLSALTSAATAGAPRVVTAAQTLGQLGSAASLILIDPAQANNTLGALTSSAVVDAIGTITAAQTLGAMTSVGGLNVTTASAAQTLGQMTSSAVVDGIAGITSAATLGNATMAGFIGEASYITGSASLDAMVSQAVIAHGHVMRPSWTRRTSNATTWTRRA